MRLNLMKAVSFNTPALACALIVSSSLAQQSSALTNASFEDPLIGPVDLSAIDPALFDPSRQDELRRAIGFQLTVTTIPGWVQTGDVRGATGGVISDTGIFSNQPIPSLGVTGIAGIDGVQLAFLVVNTLADGATEDFVSIYQATGDTFEAGKDYRFDLEVGNSNSFPGSERTPLVISIGYIDDTPGLQGSNIFKPIASESVLLGELDTSGSEVLLNQFVELLSADIAPSFLGKQVAVQARIDIPDDLTAQEKTNITGAYNIDSARFSVVPEPTSLALLATAGLLFSRRRR